MIVKQTIGGLTYTATVGPHTGTDNPAHFITVEGPGLSQPAQYLRRSLVGGNERDGLDAIRYTFDKIVVPTLVEGLQALTSGIAAIDRDDDGDAMLDREGMDALQEQARALQGAL